MKKAFVILAIIFLSTSNFVVAQHIRIGIDPGIALAKGSYKPSSGIDQRVILGFDGGVLVQFVVQPKFTIQPEVNFSMQGVEINNNITEYSIKLHYITIPVLAKLNGSKVSVFAGPQLGILLSADKDVSGGSNADIKDQFRSSDIYLVFGADYKFGRNVFFGARYNVGLQQIANNGTGFELHNRYGSLRIGYVFGG